MKSAHFQLNEKAGSKPLANKYLALTQEAQDLSCEIGRALEPIFRKAYQAGFSPRDVVSLAIGEVTIIGSEMTLLHGVTLHKEEEARQHVCGASGFGYGLDDVCPGCEYWKAKAKAKIQPCPICSSDRTPVDHDGFRVFCPSCNRVTLNDHEETRP